MAVVRNHQWTLGSEEEEGRTTRQGGKTRPIAVAVLAAQEEEALSPAEQSDQVHTPEEDAAGLRHRCCHSSAGRLGAAEGWKHLPGRKGDGGDERREEV